jgi:hypothetical protein
MGWPVFPLMGVTCSIMGAREHYGEFWSDEVAHRPRLAALRQAQLRDRRATTARGSAGLPATTLANTRGARRSRACQGRSRSPPPRRRQGGRARGPTRPTDDAVRGRALAEGAKGRQRPPPGSRSSSRHTSARDAPASSATSQPRSAKPQRVTPGGRAVLRSCAHTRVRAREEHVRAARRVSRRQPLRHPRGCPTTRPHRARSAMRSLSFRGGTGAPAPRGRAPRAS